MTDREREIAETRRNIERALRELRQHVEIELGEILSDLMRIEALTQEEQSR